MSIEETDGMPPSVNNGHVADFNVRRPIGPLTYMKSADHDIAPKNRHLVHSSPDKLDFLFAVNGYVLRIVAGLGDGGELRLG